VPHHRGRRANEPDPDTPEPGLPSPAKSAERHTHTVTGGIACMNQAPHPTHGPTDTAPIGGIIMREDLITAYPPSPRPPRRRPVALLVAGAVLVAAIGAGAALALGGRSADQSDQATATATPQPITPKESTPKQPGDPSSGPVVLADGRHPVRLTAVDPNSGTITFDLVQWYFGEDAAREAAKDHQESPPPNDYYVRNVNPKLRTLPTAAGATITVNNLLNTQQPTPVSLAKLATLTQDRSPVFWITVRHDQVLKLSEQWVP
jgi:hypothetical protein